MKTKLSRRILAVLLAVAMIMTILPTAFAKTDDKNPYDDVKGTDWFKEAVLYCYENTLMAGVTDKSTMFAPNATATRATFATVLFRLAKEPKTPFRGTFKDVPDNLWYSEAVEWAASDDIEVVKGVTEDTFKPNMNITREQLVTMLWRYAKILGRLGFYTDSLEDFTDVWAISDYALNAVEWAVGAGLLKGMTANGNDYIRPGYSATRAQIATLFMRFNETIINCPHKWGNGVVTLAPTCTATGIKTFTCSLCGDTKTETIAMIDHVDADDDGFCDVCGEAMPEPTEPATTPTAPVGGDTYVLAASIKDGDKVVIYNPGHSKAIKNENDNDWYLIPEEVTPTDNKISAPDASLVWTVAANSDGTYSFTNGTNAITAWLSNTYVELTNNAAYEGGDTKWSVTSCNAATSTFFIGSSSISTSYGTGYLECFTKATGDKIAGYASKNPSEKDFGFQFYVLGGSTPVTPTTPTTPTDPTTPSEPPITGGSYKLASSIKDGDKVVIYNPGHGKAIKNENDNNWYLIPEAVTPADNEIASPDASLIWTVVANTDGTYSFTNGTNAITAWLSGTYVELTNDASYAGGDTKWKVSPCNAETNTFFIGSSSISTSYGTGYIECYTKTDGTEKISGYAKTTPTEADFGFQFYVLGGTAVPPVTEPTEPSTDPTEPTTPTDPIIPPSESSYKLASSIKAGDKVVIYNPGHGKAIKNETDNNWYLIPEAVTPANDAITSPDISLVWTVVANTDGTYSFTNGTNAITAWLSGTYVELTNDASYAGGDTKWNVTSCNAETKTFFIGSSSISTSYGTGYLECYTKTTGDKIAGYASSNPSEGDFGFQFYALSDESVDPTEPTTPTTPTEPITEPTEPATDPTEPPVTGGSFKLASSIKAGDRVVIYNPGHGKAVKNENDNNWYLIAEAVTPAGDTITSPDDSLVWTVVKNADGTYSFTNGTNAITAWLSGTYVELTNDASYTGGDIKWNVTACNAATNTFFIGSSSISTSYGTGYLECYTKTTGDKIAGYASNSPSEGDFGFQFYAQAGNAPISTDPTEPVITPTEPVTEPTEPATDPTDPPVSGSYALTDTIAVGDKLVITATYDGAYYAYASDDANVKAVTPVNNAISNPEATQVWEVCAGSASGAYLLKNSEGKYATWKSGSALTYGDTGSDITITYANSIWSLHVDATRSIAMQMYEGAPRFRAYADSNSTKAEYSFQISFFKLAK